MGRFKNLAIQGDFEWAKSVPEAFHQYPIYCPNLNYITQFMIFQVANNVSIELFPLGIKNNCYYAVPLPDNLSNGKTINFPARSFIPFSYCPGPGVIPQFSKYGMPVICLQSIPQL